MKRVYDLTSLSLRIDKVELIRQRRAIAQLLAGRQISLNTFRALTGIQSLLDHIADTLYDIYEPDIGILY